MSSNHDISLPHQSNDAGKVDEVPGGEVFEIGQWYWLKTKKGERLACVMVVGSNFVELHRPERPNQGTRIYRVHYTEYHKTLRREPSPAKVIGEYVARYQARVADGMAAVKAVTAKLGVNAAPALGHSPEGSGNALCVMSEAPDIKKYEKALIAAKDKELPALFAQIKKDSETLTVWMSAEALPLQALMGQMEGTFDTIKDRIFNISIYAGLTEEACLVREGEPAAFHAKLHVMQRRLYMDEECLAGYRTGGIVFSAIEQFDSWLSEADNLYRILPFPRCIVAFKVRRHKKYREEDGSLHCALLNINLEQLDESTLLYIRNGERLYRLTTAIDFGEMIFPDSSIFDPSEPLMFKQSHHGRMMEFTTVREHDVRLRDYEERHQKAKDWMAANPNENHFLNPFTSNWEDIDLRSWERLDEASVYFDEAMKDLDRQVKEYNRIALIIQGLFDRSEVLHPHPPVRSWTPEGFAEAIELVYDARMTLHHGDPPDIEAYIARCNASITKDSVLYGQQLYWQRREHAKECARRPYERGYAGFKPIGNPGPGKLAIASEWKPRAQSATFTWLRERLRPPATRWDDDGPIRTSVTVPVTELFNVSAYQPGDFKQFYQDARMREKYLKWGPMFMMAEEFHAGNLQPQSPLEKQ